jgi:hypothetical protein
MSSYNDFSLRPTKIERYDPKGRYLLECSQCHARVPALASLEVEVAGSHENYVGEHGICLRCVEKMHKMFFDPALVVTKTPLFPWEAEARNFAIRAHGDQRYDSGNAPYLVHLAAVRDAVIEFGFASGDNFKTRDYVQAAWLHDVLEDTKQLAGTIGEKFGETTFTFVWAVTGRGENRKARNEDAYRKMLENPSSIPVKLADRISNGRSSKLTSPDALFEMYKREYTKFKALLEPRSRVITGCEPMWRELDKIFA